MRTVFLTAVVAACFYSGSAFADAPVEKFSIKGNKGYIYGAPSKHECSCHNKQHPKNPNLFKDIAHGVKKLDCWIKKNLW